MKKEIRCLNDIPKLIQLDIEYMILGQIIPKYYRDFTRGEFFISGINEINENMIIEIYNFIYGNLSKEDYQKEIEFLKNCFPDCDGLL